MTGDFLCEICKINVTQRLMKPKEIQLTSTMQFAKILGMIKQKNIENIKIIRLHNDIIPYLNLFIDLCDENGCNIQIPKKLLIEHGILEFFKDRIIII
jgi:hypothetical protein